MSAPRPVYGDVAAGFEPVREAFAANLAERDEQGAAFAAVRDGEPIVDLWGGTADAVAGRPWEEDTLAAIFSGTKGVVAICMLMLVERGGLALEDPVARHWPEFGKPQILVRDVLAHTARLPGVETTVGLAEFADDRRMAELLAAQAPSEDPRAALAYHPYTYGWLCGELTRRIDGRDVGRFVAEEIAGPLGLELWIGLPAELEPRVARLELAADWPCSEHLRPAAFERDPLVRSIWGNPPAFLHDSFPWNRRALHAARIPGAGGIATARSVARMYASVERLLSPATLERGRQTLSQGVDRVSGATLHYGAGFELQTARRHLGPPPDAFGHGGAGGSVHGRWPSHGIGFSYVPNRLRDDMETDPRSHALLDALHRCI